MRDRRAQPKGTEDVASYCSSLRTAVVGLQVVNWNAGTVTLVLLELKLDR